MTGISLITANNGWAMALTGALIVMTGLASLALIISQLHKIVALFEHKAVEPAPVQTVAAEPADKPSQEALAADVDLLNDPSTAARICRSLAADLGEKFKLSELYHILRREALPHPHLTVRTLRESGYLIPDKATRYKWKTE